VHKCTCFIKAKNACVNDKNGIGEPLIRELRIRIHSSCWIWIRIQMNEKFMAEISHILGKIWNSVSDPSPSNFAFEKRYMDPGLFAMIFNSDLLITGTSLHQCPQCGLPANIFHFIMDKYGTAPCDKRNLFSHLWFLCSLRRVPWCRTSASTERRAVPSWWRWSAPSRRS
jgi:hypothetical protein